MTWSGAFTTWLDSGETLYPRYLLEIETIAGGPGGSGTVAEEILSAESPSFQAQTVNPQTWEPTVGAFSIDVITDDIEGLMETARRGSPVSLKMGRSGWDYSAFERIAVGRITNISASNLPGNRYRVSCADLFSLPTRFDRTTSDPQLFGGGLPVGETTTLTADYDSVTPDTTISLASTAALDRPTGGSYLVLVTPSGGGAPFYLVGSSKGASSMTIDTPGADRYGTVRVDAASGSTVTFLALLRGHPLDLVRQIFTSTGNGTNGTYDVLPEAWGLALPDMLIDHIEISRHRAKVNFPSSTYEWSLIVATPMVSGFAQVRSLLAEAGLFMVIHEGQVAIRAAQNPREAGTGPFWTITPENVDSTRPLGWEAWDAQVPHEQSTVVVNGPTNAGGTLTATEQAGGSANIATAPAYPGSLYPRTLSHAWHLTSNVCSECADRIYPWFVTVPERFTIPMAGLIHHRLTPGTIVTVTLPRLYSRDAGGSLFQRTGMVVRQAPDWTRGPVVDVCLLPNSSTSPQG